MKTMKNKSTQMKVKHKGFTVIEIMIVILIISVLTIVALPAYQSYTTRTKMAEVVLAASTCRNTISEVALSAGANGLPDANDWGCEILPGSTSGTKYVESVTTSDTGTVFVNIRNLGPSVPDKSVLTMVPLKDETNPFINADTGVSVRIWRCGSSLDGTNVNPKYLPSSCRG